MKVLAKTHRNYSKFCPRWNKRLIIPVYIPVQEFPAIPAGTELNSEHWCSLVVGGLGWVVTQDILGSIPLRSSFGLPDAWF